MSKDALAIGLAAGLAGLAGVVGLGFLISEDERKEAAQWQQAQEEKRERDLKRMEVAHLDLRKKQQEAARERASRRHEAPETRSRLQQNHSKEHSVTIFWDIENCSVPTGCDAFDLVQIIRQHVIPNDGIEAGFKCYCNMNDLPKKHQVGVSRANVQLVHVIDNKQGAADRAIMLDLDRMERASSIGINKTLRRETIVLISGDIDFIGKLNDLRHQAGYKISVVHNQIAKSELLKTANSTWSWTDLCQLAVGTVVDTSFRCRACRISFASHSLMMEHVKESKHQKHKLSVAGDRFEAQKVRASKPKAKPSAGDEIVAQQVQTQKQKDKMPSAGDSDAGHARQRQNVKLSATEDHAQRKQEKLTDGSNGSGDAQHVRQHKQKEKLSAPTSDTASKSALQKAHKFNEVSTGKPAQHAQPVVSKSEESSDGPFPCPACAAVFGDAKALNQHQEAKHHYYDCPTTDCNRAFLTADSLLQHQQNKFHWWQCESPKCTRTYQSLNALEAHQRAKH